MIKKILIIVIALSGSAFFLFEVLSSANAFNLLPYLIHDSINKGGEGEGAFIQEFDICFSVVVFFIIYKILKKVF